LKLEATINQMSGLTESLSLLDTAGHMRTRRGPDVARGPDVVHHRPSLIATWQYCTSSQSVLVSERGMAVCINRSNSVL